MSIKHFPRYKRLRIRFWTDALPFLEEEMTEISPEAWDEVVPFLNSITVTSVAASSVDDGQTTPRKPIPAKILKLRVEISAE